MKWMEFIKVQTAHANFTATMMRIVDECVHCQGLLEAKVLQNASVGDCSLCLRWNTESAAAGGSSVGLSLSSILKQYGLVDHSVWIEKEAITETGS